ncbi:MAG: cysteine hydrolase [Firmicutes bacterium]|nr:cysteine hydrolase [Bacillota bacterium]
MTKILIVVDMQNDFISGSLGTPEAAAIVDKVVNRITNSKDDLILFTQDTHQIDYLQTPEGKKLPVEHCIENTYGWQISMPVMKAWRDNKETRRSPHLTNNVIQKPVFGSKKLCDFLEKYLYVDNFVDSRLSTPTMDHDIDIDFDDEVDNTCEIEIVGLCTDVCVVSNAILLKNMLPNVNISVNADCCAGVTPKSHIEALNTMKMCQIDILGEY